MARIYLELIEEQAKKNQYAFDYTVVWDSKFSVTGHVSSKIVIETVPSDIQSPTVRLPYPRTLYNPHRHYALRKKPNLAFSSTLSLDPDLRRRTTPGLKLQ